MRNFVQQSFVIVCVILGVTAKFPSELPRCRAGDTQCLPGVITRVLQLVKDGNPDMNLGPIEPLHINKLDIEQGGKSPIQVTLNFRDMDLHGISNGVVTRVNGFEADPRTSKFEIEAKVPRLTLAGKYKINGKVLVLPIQGRGLSNLTIDNVNLRVKFKPKVIEKNGKTYIQTDKFKLTFDTSRLYLQLDNLFNGDKALGDNMNVFLNENWKDILDELKPAVIEAFSQIFASVINTIFSKLSYDDVFEP
ncbi:protein takeout-like [Culicoides brevitarsis]|uniref:protein takeout-like n=1 Tax=Culicoides brevitarsis TaxID=469753 RepID=UPI00307C97EE